MDDFVAAALKPGGTGVQLTFPKAWEAQFYRCPPAPPAKALAAFPKPVVGIRGEPSLFLDEARFTATFADRADAWTTQLAEVGHLAPLEAPERVAAAIRQGLRETGILEP